MKRRRILVAVSVRVALTVISTNAWASGGVEAAAEEEEIVISYLYYFPPDEKSWFMEELQRLLEEHQSS